MFLCLCKSIVYNVILSSHVSVHTLFLCIFLLFIDFYVFKVFVSGWCKQTCMCVCMLITGEDANKIREREGLSRGWTHEDVDGCAWWWW